jgi:SpoIID/LytB domain protein
MFYYPAPVAAKTLEEINQEIAQKQAELNKINADMAKINAEIAANKSQQNSIKSEVAQLMSTIAGYDYQLQLLDLQGKQIIESINIKNLERTQIEEQQNSQLIDSYLGWKTSAGNIKPDSDIVKQAIYNDLYYQSLSTSILGLSTELEKLNGDKASYESEKAALDKQIADVTAEKSAVEKRLASYNAAVNAANSSLNTMKNQSNNALSQLNLLTAQQQAIEAADDENTSNYTGGGTKEIINGEIYFGGTGRDRYQGHGVGMSQYGAYGMAQKGWKAEDILKFYYTGVQVNDFAVNSQISIKYCSSNPNGKTPPCPGEEIVKRITFVDYLGGLGEMPESWPVEARKAQLIAARTYAVSYTGNGNPNNPICITPNCQVSYLRSGKTDADYMDNGDYQVAVDTGSKVVTYNGGLISAVYSSDNSQGFGTADNDTVWSNASGVGSVRPYLRHVDDSAYAQTTTYTHWAWRTNSYTMSEIDGMLNYEVANYKDGGASMTSFLATTKSTIGTLQYISFVKDGSRRVKQVRLVGNKGEKLIAGWLFKAIWNDWISRVRPSGQEDYIYSLTYSYLQQ